jgi:adenosylcobinamide-GDP ribazoletransferase
MNEPDTRPVQPVDIAMALGLLSRLPVQIDPEAAQARGARAAWAWPLAGAVIGLLAGLAGAVASLLGFAAPLAAGAALAASLMLTGAMHEDGLADSADGLWGGHDRARRLEIMKDSRIGAYGVIALVLSLGLRWAALTLLVEAGWLVLPMVAAGALSRAPMAALMNLLPNARGSGLADSVGRPPRDSVLLGLAIALALALIATGWTAALAALWAALAAFAVAGIARARIGGQTGDILGAAQQMAEMAVLAVLASAAG